jgi:hypothetical protein
MKNLSLLFVMCCSLLIVYDAEASVKIHAAAGDVQVRRGMEETWQPAKVGMSLKEIDTILVGEGGRTTLELDNSVQFTLGSMSILDIGDLRSITERELFLFLMSEKVSNIETTGKDPKLHIEKVSVVRADNKNNPSTTGRTIGTGDMSSMEINGAKALYEQDYYPNAIMKLHRILKKTITKEAVINAHFYLGKSFERIDENGRALDAYKATLRYLEEYGIDNSSIERSSHAAVERLR